MSLAIRHVGHLLAYADEHGPRDAAGRTRVELVVGDTRPFESGALRVCLRREPTAHADVTALLDALTDAQIVALYDAAQARYARDQGRRMAWTRDPGRTGEPIYEPLPDWPSPPPAEAQLPHPATTSGTRGDSPASERARLAGGGEACR